MKSVCDDIFPTHYYRTGMGGTGHCEHGQYYYYRIACASEDSHGLRVNFWALNSIISRHLLFPGYVQIHYNSLVVWCVTDAGGYVSYAPPSFALSCLVHHFNPACNQEGAPRTHGAARHPHPLLDPAVPELGGQTSAWCGRVFIVVVDNMLPRCGGMGGLGDLCGGRSVVVEFRWCRPLHTLCRWVCRGLS